MILAELLKIGVDKSLPKGARKAALPAEKSVKNFGKLLKNAVETATHKANSPQRETAVSVKTAIVRLETKPIETNKVLSEVKTSYAKITLQSDAKVDLQTKSESKKAEEKPRREKNYDPIKVLDIIYKNDRPRIKPIQKSSQKQMPHKPFEKTVESYLAYKKLDEALDTINNSNEIKEIAAKKDIFKLIEIAKRNNLEPKRIEVVQYNAKTDKTIEAYSIDTTEMIKAEKIVPIKTLEVTANAAHKLEIAAEEKNKDKARIPAKTEAIVSIRNKEIYLDVKTTFSIAQKAEVEKNQKSAQPTNEEKVTDKITDSFSPSAMSASVDARRAFSPSNEPFSPAKIAIDLSYSKERTVPVKPVEVHKEMLPLVPGDKRRELLISDKLFKSETTAIKPSNDGEKNHFLVKPAENLKLAVVLIGTERAPSADPKPRQAAEDSVKPPLESGVAPKGIASARAPKNEGGDLWKKSYNPPPMKEAQISAIKNAPLAKALEYINGMERKKEKAASAESPKKNKKLIKTNLIPEETSETKPAGKKEILINILEAKKTLLKETLKTESPAPNMTIKIEEKIVRHEETQNIKTEEKNVVKKTAMIDEKPIEKTEKYNAKIEEDTTKTTNIDKEKTVSEPIDTEIKEVYQKTDIKTSEIVRKQVFEKEMQERDFRIAQNTEITEKNVKNETKRMRSIDERTERANSQTYRESSAPKPAETPIKPLIFAQSAKPSELPKDSEPLKPVAISTETLLQNIAAAKTFPNEIAETAPVSLDLTAQRSVEAPTREGGKNDETETIKSEQPVKTETANEKLFSKIVTARQIVARFADRIIEAAQNYKPPITRLVIVLDPPELGRTEVTLTHRGQSLQVSVHSSQQAMALLVQNSAEFRQNLLHYGFSDVNISYQNPNGERQKREKQYSDDEKGTEFAFEPEKTSLEMLLYG
ncbi:MAG: flagellar hook-length control protein FliK [Helicobacteraceae bacterium]|nr:flagellar hook-length control protein FliK [Helicobacteraceae bacterium]